jgi:hypothetical protein
MTVFAAGFAMARFVLSRRGIFGVEECLRERMTADPALMAQINIPDCRRYQWSDAFSRHCEAPRTGAEAIQGRMRCPWIASLRSQ